MNAIIETTSEMTNAAEQTRVHLSDIFGRFLEARCPQLDRFDVWLRPDSPETAEATKIISYPPTDVGTLQDTLSRAMLTGNAVTGIISGPTEHLTAITGTWEARVSHGRAEDPEASTVPEYEELVLRQRRAKQVEESIDTIFESARGQDFEDGMESRFSRELVSVIRQHGLQAMHEISYLITHNKVNPEVSSEALRWIGRMEHPETYEWRLWLLEKSLTTSSPLIRDGAMLGISFMDDPHAIPFLRSAINREPWGELREDMKQVLEELEVAHNATAAEDHTKE